MYLGQYPIGDNELFIGKEIDLFGSDEGGCGDKKVCDGDDYRLFFNGIWEGQERGK